MPGENVVYRLNDGSVLSAARVGPESRRWLLTRDFSLIWSSQKPASPAPDGTLPDVSMREKITSWSVIARKSACENCC